MSGRSFAQTIVQKNSTMIPDILQNWLTSEMALPKPQPKPF